MLLSVIIETGNGINNIFLLAVCLHQDNQDLSCHEGTSKLYKNVPHSEASSLWWELTRPLFQLINRRSWSYGKLLKVEWLICSRSLCCAVAFCSHSALLCWDPVRSANWCDQVEGVWCSWGVTSSHAFKTDAGIAPAEILWPLFSTVLLSSLFSFYVITTMTFLSPCLVSALLLYTFRKAKLVTMHLYRQSN